MRTYLFLFAFISLGLSVHAQPSMEFFHKYNVLHMELDGSIDDYSFKGDNFLSLFTPEPDLCLVDYLQNIEKAKYDKRIQGIVITVKSPEVNLATLSEIRDKLIDFKSSGKFIYTYSETGMTQSAYYLCSVSDKIFLNPGASFPFTGLKASVTFYAKTLEKLGLKAEIFRHGKYKSAVEPFMNTEMSEASREMLTELLKDEHAIFLNGISQSKNIPVETLQNYMDSLSVLWAGDAYKYHLVDSLIYLDEFRNIVRKKVGDTESADKSKLTFLSGKFYRKVSSSSAGVKQPGDEGTVAVLFAEGGISMGASGNSLLSGKQIGSTTLSKQISKLAKDKDINAIVLRINSPGGDGLASDIIWRNIELAKNKKPIVADMGGVAASGGYYIAMGCDKIIAHPATITGSIGVFGMMINTEKLTKEKIGLTYDHVKTAKYADLWNPNRTLSELEKKRMQDQIERFYNDFITKAGQGRGLAKEYIDSIAQGHVWSGADGKEIKLVDDLGGLEKSIQSAAELAKLKPGTYQILYYPKRNKYGVAEGTSSKPGVNLLTDYFLNFFKAENIKSSQLAWYLQNITAGKLNILFALPGEIVIE